MKAIAVDPSQKTIALIDAPEPALAAPTEAKLRMLEVGVCGTDKEICQFAYGTPPPGKAELIIGHESLAEVAQVGAGVKNLAPGDLVVTMVRRPCPHPECVACRSGRQDFCYTGDFTERGIKGRDGFMAEWVVDDAQYMVKVPRELRDVAVLVEPLTIAEKALEQMWQVQQRLPWMGPGVKHKALVLGAGPVGLLGAMALRASGFDVSVYSGEPSTDPKAAVTGAIGGTYLCAKDVPVGDLGATLGQIDLVFEATGASSLSFAVLEQLGTNAVFIFTGVPGRKNPIEVDAGTLMRNLVLKNQIVFGTVNAGRSAFEAAIRDLGRFRDQWPDATRGLITGRFPAAGYRDLLLGRAGGIKNVVAM